MKHYTPKQNYTIYLIQINSTSYVGQTSSYHNRKRDHLSALQSGRHHNIHLQRAYDKYGVNSIEWSILERCSKDEADSKERHWVKFFNSYENGFNQNEGGENTFGKPCTWNGIDYPSLSAAAESNGVSTTTMQRRLDAGYTCDADVPKKGDAVKVAVVWNGIQYSSITECAAANGYSTSALRSKLNQGYVCDEDIPEQAEWSRKPCVWNGVEYPSLAECSRQTGIPVTTLGGWFSRGYTSDSDVKPPIKLDIHKAELIRELFRSDWSYSQIADEFNVSPSLVSMIVRNKIWQSTESNFD